MNPPPKKKKKRKNCFLKGSMSFVTFFLGPFYYQALKNPKKEGFSSSHFDHCIFILKHMTFQ